jgi:hypothetical protein
MHYAGVVILGAIGALILGLIVIQLLDRAPKSSSSGPPDDNGGPGKPGGTDPT